MDGAHGFVGCEWLVDGLELEVLLVKSGRGLWVVDV